MKPFIALLLCQLFVAVALALPILPSKTPLALSEMPKGSHGQSEMQKHLDADRASSFSMTSPSLSATSFDDDDDSLDEKKMDMEEIRARAYAGMRL